MDKLRLYLENVLIGLWHVLWAALWSYHTSEERGYFHNLLVAIDELVNAITLGDRDETISSRAGKARDEGKEWGCVLCRFLNIFDDGHCTKAVDKSKGKNAVVPD